MLTPQQARRYCKRVVNMNESMEILLLGVPWALGVVKLGGCVQVS